MEATPSFGVWLRQRRRALDLTQDELGQQVGCTGDTIRKIEVDARRPSKEIAARLAVCLDIAAEERAAFVRFARGESSILIPAPLPLPMVPVPTPP